MVQRVASRWGTATEGTCNGSVTHSQWPRGLATSCFTGLVWYLSGCCRNPTTRVGVVISGSGAAKYQDGRSTANIPIRMWWSRQPMLRAHMSLGKQYTNAKSTARRSR